MRKLVFILTIVSFNLICHSQNINETIEYINDKLEKYDHTSFLTKTMNAEYAPDWDISCYNKWFLLQNGELVIQQITINEGVKSIGYDIKFFIKALSDSIEIEKDLDMYEKPYYIITIRCKNYGCMISKTTDEPTSDKMSYYSFTVTDKVYSKRIVNAIKKLIQLANESKNFREDDPFK